jgi:antitoxin ParD1/3/4
MTITLRPEHELMISEALRSGAYESADEVIGRALEMLNFQDEWLHKHREAIQAKISRGLAQLDRGEGISGELSRSRLEEKKRAWLEENDADP